jgi:F0F1-type ATP synthase assembly protein I
MNEEELKQINQMFNDTIVKIDKKIAELSKSVGKTVEDKKEYAEEKINENALAYMAGAFVGGIVVGYAISKGKRN